MSLVDDPTVWVPAVKSDPSYEIVAEPYCVDATAVRFGALATNPSISEVVITTDIVAGGIVSFEAVPEGTMETIFAAAQNITAIAIDYKAQNIFLTDSTMGVLIVQYGKLRPYYRIVTEDGKKTNGLAINQDNNFVYFIESNKIRRMESFGNNLEMLGCNVKDGSSITIDHDQENLIFMDGDKIMKADYECKNVETLVPGLSGPDKELSGIAYDQGYIFGTVKSNGNLMIWKLENSDLMATIQFGNSKGVAGSIAVRKVQTIKPTGQCFEKSEPCDQICTHYKEGGMSCKCGIGYQLNEDTYKTCYSDYVADHFVLLTDVSVNGMYQIDTVSGMIHGVPTQGTLNQNIVMAVYDTEEQQVIWIDSGNNTLRSLALSEGSNEKVIHTFDENAVVSSIALDKYKRDIYYVDFNQKLIGRVSLSGGQKTIITLPDDKSPFQMAIDTHGGYIYWTEINNPAGIFRAIKPHFLADPIANSGIADLSGITLNVRESQLFWLDKSNGKVEKATMAGGSREVLLTDPGAINIAVDSDYFYVIKSHDMIQYSLTDKIEAALRLNIFGSLNGISVYPRPCLPPETTTEEAAETTRTEAIRTTVTTTTTETSADKRGGSSIISGTVWPNVVLWTIIWLCQVLE